MNILCEKKLYNCYIQVFKVPIYGSKVCFIKYKSKEGFNKAIKFLKSINFNTDEVDTNELADCYGFVYNESSDYGKLHILFVNTSRKHVGAYTDTLSHEGTHLIQDICEHHGLEHYKRSANEHIAYLTGYIMDYLFRL